MTKYHSHCRTPLASGTYGKRALKEIPKPGRKRRPRKGQSRGGSGINTPGGAFQPHAPSLPVLQEQDDSPTPNYPPPPQSVQGAGGAPAKKRYQWPGKAYLSRVHAK